MKMIKLIKSIAIFILILGVCLLTGCHQNQIPGGDDVDCTLNPEHEDCKEEPIDCEKNPDHEDCKEEEPYPFSMGFTFYELEDSKGVPLNAYSVAKYEGSDKEVKIPSVFKDKPVIKIADNTFANNTNIAKVIIPDSIQLLGKNVFSNCKSLSEVEFAGASTVQIIPDSTFYKCVSLKNIVLPSSVKQIGETAFYGCSSITELRMPISVVSIGRNAFGDMQSLTTLSVPFIGGGRGDSTEIDVLGFVFSSDPTPYGTEIIQKTEKGNKKYYIPNTLKTIEILAGKTSDLGYGALSGLTTIDTIIIPNTITKFGEYAFSGSEGIKNILYTGSIAEWTKIIGQYDAGNKEVLESIKITYDYIK